MLKKFVFILFTIFSMNVLSQAEANKLVTSREYKLILDSNLFSYENEASVIQRYFKEMSIAIESAIDRKVSNKYKLSKQRNVIFYDTPKSCLLKHIGYSFRERVTINDGKSSVSLKFRSLDQKMASLENVSSSIANAKSKFELDIGFSHAQTMKQVYSVSTKYNDNHSIHTMADINNAFPYFKSTYDFNHATPLVAVGGLKIYERVYEGMKIDLGHLDAKVSLTLWYPENPSLNTKPLIVEVSFSYGDKKGIHSKKVIKRAKKTLYAMAKMKRWNSLNPETKTAFVYNYDANFCRQK